MSEVALIYHCISYFVEVSQFSSAKATSRLAKEPRAFLTTYTVEGHLLKHAWCTSTQRTESILKAN